MTKPKRKIDLFACHTDELHLLVVMSFTCVFLPFYIKVYYCEMFGFCWRCVWLFYVLAILQPWVEALRSSEVFKT